MIDCFCDYEPADFYFVTKHKARKLYRCGECCGFILPGEQYEKVFASWDGCKDTLRTCKRCYDIRVWTKNNVPCFCWAHGNMLEDAAEAVEDAAFRAPSETIGLRFGFLRRKIEIEKHNRRVRQS